MTAQSTATNHAEGLARARLALDGLSVGDGFGQRFFSPGVLESHLPERRLPHAPWRYTDDTEMACAILEVLTEHGRIDQDSLAHAFARRYAADPARGYGSGAHHLLGALCRGEDWRAASRGLFRGEGSMGNGAAMRVAPVGAYFADDFSRTADEADRSAEVTHSHPEGRAGAVAIGIAAAWAWQWWKSGRTSSPIDLIRTALQWTPPSATRDGISTALQLPLDEWEHDAARILGNGSQIIAADTVPFCLWCAAAHLHDFGEALWTAARVGGDIDTTCAIIGGIVATATGAEGIPDVWLRSRESLCVSTSYAGE